MFENGRRSAISSSELGLYSDRADRYNASKYGSVIKKFVIVVMAIVTVILAAIFIYDFASGASASSKVSQETKHIYILQNALKKPSNFSKRIITKTTAATTIPPPSSRPDFERLTAMNIEHRSDNDDVETLSFIDTPKIADEKGESLELDSAEPRAQSLENYKLKKKHSESAESDDVNEEKLESKQLISNHAVVYRVRQMYQHGETEDEETPIESKPTPFHFKLTNPTPTSFKRLKFPQLTQYRYPHNSRNIQDIIKYLTNEPKGLKGGIKFTGVYVNPKKYDFYPDIEGMNDNDKSELSTTGETENAEESESLPFSIINSDPFYPYKPKHPADVNLLAPTNVRFSPTGLTRYNPYYESYIKRPFIMRPPLPSLPPPLPIESSYDSNGAYSGNYGRKKKAKPFSVMLDIYPISEINDQPTNIKVSRLKTPSSTEDYTPDSRKPFTYSRAPRLYGSQTQPIPLVALPANNPGISEEEELQQMIFHLNLYPRKKNKFTRKDILERSEVLHPEDQEELIKKIWSPFDAITKQLTDHSAIEKSKGETYESGSTNSQLNKYEESILEITDEMNRRNENILCHDKDNVDHISVEKINETTETIEEEAENITSFADGLIAMD